MKGTPTNPSACLIINADDFGYYDGITKGIVEAANHGTVTATGVMANGPALERWVAKLKGLTSVSVGVHLNATLGHPLTDAMRDNLGTTQGEFPAKETLAYSLFLGRIPASVIRMEWQAQIERCLEHGLKPQFLNSHEHVHMLPGLYTHVRELADKFDIAHVRAPSPEWRLRGTTPSDWIRNSYLAASKLRMITATRNEPLLIGVAVSGQLDFEYCKWRFPRLTPGRAHELMCHPGRVDPIAQSNSRLHAYHDWEGELCTLLSTEFRQLLQRCKVNLTNYIGLRCKLQVF
jgi:predicted glycoside hydrolase/deacetylase ChbG (UPF0249 family)